MVGDLESITGAAQAALKPDGAIDELESKAAAPAAGADRDVPWPPRELSLDHGGWVDLYAATRGGDPNPVELILTYQGRSVGSLRVACGWIDNPANSS